MSRAVRAFEMNLKVFWKQLEYINLYHFSSDNFKIRFNDLCCHATNICVFENPFSVEVSDAREKLQVELTELQYDSILHSSFNQETLIIFYASLPVSQFSKLA
jgi:hypothetical protein